MSQPEHAIVVGVDGSDRAMNAATWAGVEAQRRRARLHLVMVNDDPAHSEFLAPARARIAGDA